MTVISSLTASLSFTCSKAIRRARYANCVAWQHYLREHCHVPFCHAALYVHQKTVNGMSQVMPCIRTNNCQLYAVSDPITALGCSACVMPFTSGRQ